MSDILDPSKDYYDLLGVTWLATQDQLKHAYKRSAEEFYPTSPGGRFGSADIFITKKIAYEILRDPITRAQYDNARMVYIADHETLTRNLRPRPTKPSYVDAVVIKQEPDIVKQEFEFEVQEDCMLDSTTTFSTYFYADYREKNFLADLRAKEKSIAEEWLVADLAARNAKQAIKSETTIQGRQIIRDDYQELKLEAERLRLQKMAAADDRKIHTEVAHRLKSERQNQPKASKKGVAKKRGIKRRRRNW